MMRIYLLLMLLMSLLSLSLVSCKTRYIPQEIHHYHNSDSVRSERDTILIRDSVVVYIAGDTVKIREVREKERIREVESKRRQNDSIPLPQQISPTLYTSPRPPQEVPIVIYVVALLVVVIMIKNK